jgi:ribosomal protein S6
LNRYEVTLILDPTLSDSDTRKLLEELRSLLGQTGASEIEPERMEHRILAYPIRKHNEANYLHIGFTAPSSTPAALRTALKHREGILRLNFLRLPHGTAVQSGPAAAAEPAAEEQTGGTGPTVQSEVADG